MFKIIHEEIFPVRTLEIYRATYEKEVKFISGKKKKLF